MFKIVFVLMLSLAAYAQTPLPVAYANPKAFSGLWYEIARTYNQFQKTCVASTVEYQLTDENTYDVYNRCFDGKIGGKLISYKGKAKPLKGDSVSELKMTYFWIFSKEYRIIYLNKDYTTAIVCDDEMDSLWIMHRKPIMTKKKQNDLLALLKPHIDTSRLIFTPQDPQGRYQ